MFGGKVNSWKKSYNTSKELPDFCYELQCALQIINEHFVEQPDNVKYIKIAHHIERKEGYSWDNSAIAFWLHDLEA